MRSVPKQSNHGDRWLNLASSNSDDHISSHEASGARKCVGLKQGRDFQVKDSLDEGLRYSVEKQHKDITTK